MSILSLIVWCLVIGFILYILRKYFNGPKTPLSKSLIGKIAVVTGCTAGIGKETALELLEKGAKVIFACRDEQRTTDLLNSIQDPKMRENAIFIKLDLCDFSSIINFANEFKSSFRKFDILINNAGSIVDTFTLKEGIESSILTNHIGHTLLTALIINNLNPEGQIIILSSRLSLLINEAQFNEILNDLDFSQMKNSYNPLTVYSFSKLANVLHAIHLDNYARKKNMKFKTASLHPGTVASEALSKNTTLAFRIVYYLTYPFRFLLFKDCKMGAQTTLHICYMDYNKLNSGAYFSDCAETKKNILAEDSENVIKVMEYSKQLIRKNFNNRTRDIENIIDEI